jgi:hypothetical protein
MINPINPSNPLMTPAVSNQFAHPAGLPDGAGRSVWAGSPNDTDDRTDDSSAPVGVGDGVLSGGNVANGVSSNTSTHGSAPLERSETAAVTMGPGSTAGGSISIIGVALGVGVNVATEVGVGGAVGVGGG